MEFLGDLIEDSNNEIIVQYSLKVFSNLVDES